MSELDSECDGSGSKVYGGYTAKNAAHLTYKAVRYSRRALAIDKTSRFAFPCEKIDAKENNQETLVTFAVFNMFYWMYYLMEDLDVQINHFSH